MRSELVVVELHESDLGAALRSDRTPSGAVLALFSDARRRDRASFVGLRDAAEARACSACVAGHGVHSLTCCGNAAQVLLRDGLRLAARFDESGAFDGVTQQQGPPGVASGCAAQEDWAERLLDLFIHEPREETFLQEAVHLMRALLGCRYGAVSIVQSGALVRFLTSGVSDEVAAQIGQRPEGRGLLGLVLQTGESWRVDDMSSHPLACGFPDRHPPMRTLLIVPIGLGKQVFGRLYFCDRVDGAVFDEQDERRTAALAALMARLVGLQRYEQTVAELDQRLRELERVASSARLAAELTHDLRNVSSAVSGYCELLRSARSASLREAYVDGIESAVERASELVRRVLLLARVAPDESAVTEFAAVAAALEPMLRAVLGSGVELALDIDPRMPPLGVDAAELEMALLNLALNSKAAMPSGGRLAIRAGVRISEQSGAPWSFVEVEDSGSGFDEEALAHAYSSISHWHSRRAGHGFGLRSVRRFVERAGGELEIVSRAGHGALVRLHMPGRIGRPTSPAGRECLAAAESAAGRCDGRACDADAPHRAVLLCADAADDDAGCDHLSEYGFESLCVESVDAAFARVRESRSRLLIVLADGEGPAREQLESLAGLPNDIALAVLSDTPLPEPRVRELEGRATFLDRTMPAPVIGAELLRLSTASES